MRTPAGSATGCRAVLSLFWMIVGSLCAPQRRVQAAGRPCPPPCSLDRAGLGPAWAEQPLHQTSWTLVKRQAGAEPLWVLAVTAAACRHCLPAVALCPTPFL